LKHESSVNNLFLESPSNDNTERTKSLMLRSKCCSDSRCSTWLSLIVSGSDSVNVKFRWH
jgi:hypothetical protein